MAKDGWVDYAKAAPILLPASLVRCWHGFYLPARRGEIAELELPRQRLRVCNRFDFKRPKTDYDRACAALLAAGGGVAAVRAGPGRGLVLSAVNGPLTWWPERRMIVNGRELPAPSRLGEVRWSDGIRWSTRASEFVLMNACDHGRDPTPRPRLTIRIPAGAYVIQSGRYGWGDADPVLDLYQFLPGTRRRTNRRARPTR